MKKKTSPQNLEIRQVSRPAVRWNRRPAAPMLALLGKGKRTSSPGGLRLGAPPKPQSQVVTPPPQSPPRGRPVATHVIEPTVDFPVELGRNDSRTSFTNPGRVHIGSGSAVPTPHEGITHRGSRRASTGAECRASKGAERRASTGAERRGSMGTDSAHRSRMPSLRRRQTIQMKEDYLSKQQSNLQASAKGHH